ncbi:hypothetical protein Droror1_Dr00006300 [Drosera rotundifolia]
MDNETGPCSTQLIDGDGNFNVAGIDHFMKEVKLAECGLSYAIVSIMGPQSSGMSSYLYTLSYHVSLNCCVRIVFMYKEQMTWYNLSKISQICSSWHVAILDS